MGALGFVGSIGGEAHDWSDVDLLVAVPDHDLDHYETMTTLPVADNVVLSLDARHKAPRGAGSFGGPYIVDGLPLWVDWCIYPLSMGAWVEDALVVFDRLDLPRLPMSFDQYLASRPRPPAIPQGVDAQRLLHIGLMPVAAKRIARRSPDALGSFSAAAFRGMPHPPRNSRHYGISLHCARGTARTRGVPPQEDASGVGARAVCPHRPGDSINSASLTASQDSSPAGRRVI